MANYWHVLFFSLIGGVFSLWGGILLLSHKKTAVALARYATPFAAGALLAAAFFDLLPEAIEKLAEGAAPRWVLGGIVLFFLLEHFLHWFHHHHEHGEDESPAPLIVAGDSLHNLIDGIAIGAAFLIDVPTGIVAAIAVAAHEIPQEIGDFGLLLKFGYPKRKVILINLFSALMATFGALITFWIGSEATLPVGELLAITAGMFIYIAASDLIPTIHEESKRKIGHLAAALLILGIAVVGITTEIAHEYIDAGHEHEESSEHVEEEHHKDEEAHEHEEGADEHHEEETHTH
jgi:zinc and cadmium transporter